MLSPLKPIPPEIRTETEAPPGIKAVLFDIYGTLLISGSGDISLASLQHDTLGMDDIFKDSDFVPIFKGCCRIIPEMLNSAIRNYHEKQHKAGISYPEVDIRDIWKSVLNNLWDKGLLEDNPGNKSVDLLALRHELSANPVWPMPGFPEIIQQLNRSGLQIGIVSNAQFYTPLIIEALTGETLEETGFRRELCAWSYADQIAKPSPDIFKKPLARLSEEGISPHQVLYVGNDMLNDVSTAAKAGCKTALFAGDRRSLRLREGDERVKEKPDMIISELKQLESIIPDKG